MALAITTLHGMVHIIIPDLLPGDMACIGIHILVGDFISDSDMAGWDGDFTHTDEACGAPGDIDMDIDMDTGAAIEEEEMQVLEPVIVQGNGILPKMYITIDRTG